MSAGFEHPMDAPHEIPLALKVLDTFDGDGDVELVIRERQRFVEIESDQCQAGMLARPLEFSVSMSPAVTTFSRGKQLFS